MTLPTREEVLSLDFDWHGEPFVRINGPGVTSSLSLDFDWRGEPFVALAEASVQLLRPISDVSDGAWTPSTGSDLYATIDETVADDADYDQTTVASSMTVALTPGLDPGLSTGHKVRYRIRGSGDLEITLLQGATPIASWSHAPAPSSFTTYEQTLSGAEADAITDYADLRLTFEAI